MLSICVNSFKPVGKEFPVKLVERRGATVKNLKYKLYFNLLTLFKLLHDSICYFIVVMSSLLFYNVEIVKIKKNPSMTRCVQTFDWYCT